MKKKRRGLKALIIILTVLLVLLTAGFIALHFMEKDDRSPIETEPENIEETIQTLLEDFEELTLDKNGTFFVNDEIIVLVPLGTAASDVETLAERYDAEVIDAMEDVGIYQFKLKKSEDLYDLEDIIEELNAEELVDSAYINAVTFVGEDSETEELVPVEDPVYPDDSWNGADWDTDVPRGENWGMEAIHAPQAWGYLDQLATVNVGLIDSMVDTGHDDLDVAEAYLSLYDLDNETWSTQNAIGSLSPHHHGTHVAGIMAAVWDTDGVSGALGDKANLYYSVAKNARGNQIVSVYNTAYTYVKAISLLLDQDVQAINISQNTSRLIGFAASRGNRAAINHLQTQADLAEAMLLRIVESRKEAGRPDFVICVAAGNNNALPYYRDSNATYGFSETSPSFGQEAESGDAQAVYNNFLNMIDDPEVAGRIIVVGALGIDHAASTTDETRYEYAYFSNIGERIDIGAPGVDVYSTYYGNTDYRNSSGTSMSTPHVTAAAGIVFAANPELSGPDVKKIVCASAYGRYYYTDGYCGMLDLNVAVRSGLATVDHSVNRVIGTSNTDGLDLCFLVDTTGSMSDDIDNAKQNMISILESMAAKTPDYRVALVDYRDFADRTGRSYDYPASIKLDFSSDQTEIISAINGLDLGYGGDQDETVYSGFAKTLELDWRYNANKVIIVLGDAAPLDPEPVTNYTYDSIAQALYNADIAVDVEASDDRVLGEAEDSLIRIYTIGTEAASDAIEFFQSISAATGGAYTGVEDASQVSDAIIGSIEMIEIEPLQTVTVDFGTDFSGETVEMYYDDEYQFSYTLNSRGKMTLEDLKIDEYDWEITRLHRNGTLEVNKDEEDAEISMRKEEWNSFLYVIWERQRTEAYLYIAGTMLGLIIVLVLLNAILAAIDRLRAKKHAPAKAASPSPETAAPAVPPTTAPYHQSPSAPTAPPAPPVMMNTAPEVRYSMGKRKAQQKKVCPLCGTVHTPDTVFCTECGTRI